MTLPDAARLTGMLADSMWGPVHVVGTTGSTNADLAGAARRGAREGHVLVADGQTSGRGRLERSWASPPGTSLSVSVLLEPVPGFEHWGWLSLLAGLAVSEALTELAPPTAQVELKWPNDVLVGGGKVCGILSERVEHPDGARAVVGMGLNVALTADQLPVPTATSLLLEGFTADREVVSAGVLRQFEHHYQRWQRRGSLRAEYEARCTSVGADLTISLGDDQQVPGRGRGVDEHGRLLVETADGLVPFAVGDVVHARLRR